MILFKNKPGSPYKSPKAGTRDSPPLEEGGRRPPASPPRNFGFITFKDSESVDQIMGGPSAAPAASSSLQSKFLNFIESRWVVIWQKWETTFSYCERNLLIF